MKIMLKMTITCFGLTTRCRSYIGKIVNTETEILAKLICNFRALCAPGWIRKWHVCVRVIKSRKMVGFISAVPIRMKVYDR